MIDADLFAHLRLDDDGAPPAPELITDEPMHFKLGCRVRGELDKLHFNACVFATRDECDAYGRDLYRRWTMLDSYEIVVTDEPVTYRFVDGAAYRLEALAR